MYVYIFGGGVIWPSSSGPKTFAAKFAQEFALRFAPPRGKIRTGFALQDAEDLGFSGVAAVSRYTPPKRPCRTCRP